MRPPGRCSSRRRAFPRTRSGTWACGSPLEVPEPDVPIADGVLVILERERQPVGMGCIWRAALVRGGARQGDVVLHQDAVMKHGKRRGALQRAIRGEAGPVK